MPRTEDGSIISPDGKVLYFSLERFMDDICDGDCCFMCGVSPQDAPFNKEHILPNWLLRRFDLHNRSIVLPNGNEHRYGTYVVPCCEACNSLMSERIEIPVSRLLSQGSEAVYAHLRSEGPRLLFTWMSLIFLKIHLKDTGLRWHLDHRSGNEAIADEYNWKIFHHLHALARSFYIDATINPEAFGSMICMPMKDIEGEEKFDLADLSLAQTLFIRIDDIAIYTVFDDSCASMHGLQNLIENINGAISRPQARELAARLACCNLDLVNRPEFFTQVINGSSIVIGGVHEDTPIFPDTNSENLGPMMERILGDYVQHITNRPTHENMNLLRSGRLSFLFDDDGNFIS